MPKAKRIKKPLIGDAPYHRRSPRVRNTDEKLIDAIKELAMLGGLAGPKFFDLKRRLQAEIGTSHDLWTGKGVPIGAVHFEASPSERVAVQGVGKAHGCHECRTKIAADSDQPWIGDHIPPVELTAHKATAIRSALKLNPGQYRLYPHCDTCAAKQAQLVRSGRTTSLSPLESKLLSGGTTRFFVKTSSPRVGASDGLQIQRLGGIHGCHSCGTKFPKSTYHADHYPPQSFHRKRALLFFEAAGIDLPDPELRPHCPRCSHHQGGKAGKIDRLLKEMIELAKAHIA